MRVLEAIYISDGIKIKYYVFQVKHDYSLSIINYHMCSSLSKR